MVWFNSKTQTSNLKTVFQNRWMDGWDPTAQQRLYVPKMIDMHKIMLQARVNHR